MCGKKKRNSVQNSTVYIQGLIDLNSSIDSGVESRLDHDEVRRPHGHRLSWGHERDGGNQEKEREKYSI
jgi:hypothetical protein